EPASTPPGAKKSYTLGSAGVSGVEEDTAGYAPGSFRNRSPYNRQGAAKPSPTTRPGRSCPLPSKKSQKQQATRERSARNKGRREANEVRLKTKRQRAAELGSRSRKAVVAETKTK